MLASAARTLARRRRHRDLLAAQRAFSVPAGDGDAAPPLANVRVLDVGQVVAGNFAGAMLGYFGE